MICPFCGADSGVTDSRPMDGGRVIRRRRKCIACEQRFVTYERTRFDSCENISFEELQRGVRLLLRTASDLAVGIGLAIAERETCDDDAA